MKWNNLIYGILFSGLGAFSYFLLVDYTNLSPHRGTCKNLCLAKYL